MSIKDRLTRKTEGVVKSIQNPSSEVPVVTTSEAKVPRTGPGQMLAFRAHMQENSIRVEELESRLREFDDSLPVRALDPTKVFPSKWANRHGSSFENAEFAALKKEVESAGKNIQPIRVRPRAGTGGEYEIVYGHRRHQACLQLGIPVLSVIEDVTDRELFSFMDRENRARANLSPYEQGEMYRRALDDGLFPSLRMLAVEVGADPGNVSKAISIARLPEDVVRAFASPTEIQYRWGQLLQIALQKDPEGVMNRAKELHRDANTRSSLDVLDHLIGRVKKIRAASQELMRKGKSVGRIKRAADGSLNIVVKAGVLDDLSYKRLQDAIESVIARP